MVIEIILKVTSYSTITLGKRYSRNSLYNLLILHDYAEEFTEIFCLKLPKPIK